LATFFAIPTSQLTPFQNSLFLDGDLTENLSTTTPTSPNGRKDLIWLFAENDSGKISTNFQAIKMCYDHSPTSLIFSPIPFIFKISQKYLPKKFIGIISVFTEKLFKSYHLKSLENRLANISKPPQKQYYKQKSPIKLGHIFVMLVALYCLSWNMGNLGSEFHTPVAYNWIGLALHVDQFWGMFSPHPPKAHWYYIFQAELEDGREVEIFKNEGLFRWEYNIPFNFDKPEPFAPSFKNHRWYKFFEMGFNGANHENVRLNFGRWVCREWNARHEGNDRLYHYTVHFLLEWQNLYGDRNPPTKQVLWDHICYVK